MDKPTCFLNWSKTLPDKQALLLRACFYKENFYLAEKLFIKTQPTCGEFVKEIRPLSKEKLLIRACHACSKINESYKEIERCMHCNKSFLPLRYFEKIHNFKDLKWEKHFSDSDELEDDDLIRGLFVLW